MGNHTVNKKEKPDYIKGAAEYTDSEDILVTVGIVVQTERELETSKSNSTKREQSTLFVPENVIGETPDYMIVKLEDAEKER